MAAAVGLGVSGSAQAATCSSAKGVSVVVDFHQLGGGVQTACDAGGVGKTAYAQLQDVGHRLEQVQRTPGFVCRIDGLPSPADDPCVNTPPADAYWSLWWSDGKSGRWTYASQAASSLTVPAGGYVGMSWQGSGAKSPPGAPPSAHRTQPTSSPSTHPPSSHPSTSTSPAPPTSSAPSDPTTSPSAPSSGPGASRQPRHGKATHDQHSTKPKPSSDGSDGTHAVGPAANVSDGSGGSGGSGSDGLPGWVAPVAIAVLFVGAGTIVVARRRSSGGG